LIVLIVDDSPVYLKLLRAQLEGDGHEIVEANNGAEALQALEHRILDAVISDILMPLMDGYRLCHEIRKSSTVNAGVAIVLYTATYSSSSDRELAQTMGADYYLFKPAPTAAILEALEEARSKSTRRKNSGAPVDPDNAVQQIGSELAHKLAGRPSDPNDLPGTHQYAPIGVEDVKRSLAEEPRGPLRR
jgi:CheY-like chemotaxis protein